MPLKKAENPQESSDRRMEMGFWISSREMSGIPIRYELIDDAGAIDDDEFKQMKKEILGK